MTVAQYDTPSLVDQIFYPRVITESVLLARRLNRRRVTGNDDTATFCPLAPRRPASPGSPAGPGSPYNK